MQTNQGSVHKLMASGRQMLGQMKPTTSAITTFISSAQALATAVPDAESAYCWFSCVLALRALSQGNFGVGALLVDARGRIVAKGGNQIFAPRFSSAAHAEMVAMNEFERRSKEVSHLARYTLFTSLESCPMCLVRLLTAGVGTVIHVAPDALGGMVKQHRALPGAWRQLAAGRVYRAATCAPAFKELAAQIFAFNRTELNTKLRRRGITRARTLL
jgi:tRNA(Arg) A34 adenosine deaminase TadA